MNTYDLVTSNDSERTEYTKPTPVRVTHKGVFVGWAVFGTNYRYIHTTAGDMRLWKSRSGAAKAARNYVGL